MSNSTSRNRYDAVIVGARCAGASTAMLLARKGARVMVVDRDQHGTDTMSTHALMRSAVLQLHRWGVLENLQKSGVPAIRKTSFFYGPEVVEVDIAPAHGTDALFAPRRTVLDAALVDAAAQAGADIRFGTGCRGLVCNDDGRVTGVEIESSTGRSDVVWADIVIGADGRHSSVARRVSAQTLRRSEHASAVCYGYFEGLPNLGYRWYWDKGVAGGIIPTNDGLSCVFFAAAPDTFRDHLTQRDEAGLRRAIAARLPRMVSDLSGARLASPLITFRGAHGYVRQSHGSGWALVGDAGYFKDPITAHGITDALRDSEILADAIIAGRPADYPQTRDALSADFFRLTDTIASYDWTFDSLKAMHMDLNRAMKGTQSWIVENLPPMPLAA